MIYMIFRITAPITFALWAAGDSCIKALTVLFLALRFFTIAYFLFRGVFAPVFPNHPYILNLFVIFMGI